MMVTYSSEDSAVVVEFPVLEAITDEVDADADAEELAIVVTAPSGKVYSAQHPATTGSLQGCSLPSSVFV